MPLILLVDLFSKITQPLDLLDDEEDCCLSPVPDVEGRKIDGGAIMICHQELIGAAGNFLFSHFFSV
jgi:hypothetical protein